MKFNAKQTVDKIYSLASKQGIKIGDLEEKCGLSKGYLSRLSKSESTAPSIEVLLNIAEQLGTTLNYLLSPDKSELTPNEKDLIAFIDKLIDYTEKYKLDWSTDKNNKIIETQFHPFTPSHPLMIVDFSDITDLGEEYYQSHFDSEFFDGRVDLNKYSFHANLPISTAVVYLMSVKYFYILDSKSGKYTTTDEIELYVVEPKKKVKGLCSTHGVSDEVKEKIKELYNSVANNKTNVNFDEEAKLMIRNFMGLHELGE